MLKELLFQPLLLCLLVTAFNLNAPDAYASELAANQRALETRAYPVIGPDSRFAPGPVAFGNGDWRPCNRDAWLIGNSWYDYQHNATQGKQIAVSENGTVHICWMKGYNEGASDRHAVYVCYQEDTLYGPVSVDNTARSGYCTIDVMDSIGMYENAAVVAFHQNPGSGLGTTVSPDWGSCWLAFLPCNHPPTEFPPIWPHIAIDNSNKVHVIAIPETGGGISYDATLDFATWETPAWIPIPTSGGGISATVVTSEFDDQVAILTHNHLPLHPNEGGLIFSQMNNDVWVHISADGDFTDWEQVSSINVTQMEDAENTEHPLPGHVYGYCDIDGVFDSDGNLHLGYTTRPYWADYTLLDGVVADSTYFERWARTGQVWHAMIAAVDEEIEFSHIAGYVGSNNEDHADFATYFDGDPGGWGSLNDRPSLAIDPATNTLYCMWRNFTNLPDTSAGGFSNADLWMRSSCDYGSSWGPAVNITDTYAPACVAGDCASEAWGTLAEIVYDGKLHLEFLEDLDAGGIVQDEGAWTDNPVWYVQVPVEDVPCGDAWNSAAHATCLAGTAWNWGALEDGSYEIVDFMHLLNEGASTLTLDSIELLYFENIPDIDVSQINGNLGDPVELYQVGLYEYVWNAVIGDDEYDAVIRFHTSGGSVDFTLANRNPLDLETAQSMLWWEDVPPAEARSPQTITLAQNYPNPFNPTTTIEYTLATPATVQLEIYNTLGEMVAQPVGGYRAAGTHSVVFDAGDLASGVYLYRLTAGNYSVTQKMVLVR